MVNLAAVRANIQGGTVILTSKIIHARLYTGLLVLWLSEQHKKPGCLGELARGTTVFGIKGENVFCQLVDISDNLPIDWMHCICKGILKRQLLKWWFNLQYATDSYSLPGISHELDNMFLSTKLPRDFTRKAHSTADLKHWKPSEFRLFSLCWTAMSSTCCTFWWIWWRPLLSLCTILLFISCTQFLFPNLV